MESGKILGNVSWMFEFIRHRDERRKLRVTETTTSATHNPAKKGEEIMSDILSGFTASSVRRPKKSIGRFLMATP